MEEDELNQEKKRKNKRKGKHPLKDAQKKAENVSKGAQKASDALKKSSEKYAKNAAKQGGKKAVKTAAKSTQRAKQTKKMASVAKNAQKIASLIAKLGPIIATVGLIILIIIIIIGLLVFIITGLGLIMSGLQSIVTAFGDGLLSFVYGEQYVVHDDEILDTLQYLQEMDYDLYGYGFSALPDPIKETTDPNTNETKKELGYPSPGVLDVSWAWDKIEQQKLNHKAYRYILAYLISDNYSSILQHQNRTLKDIVTFAPGSGLLALYHEAGNLGERGDRYNKFERGSVTVSNNKLRVSEKGFFNRSIMEYDLDGWTGRYGMPLEFLLSVHLATMAPDLSFRMATEFETEVQILLHEVEGEINSAIQRQGGNGQQIQYDELTDIQDNWVLDRFYMSDEEALEIFTKYDGIIESYIGDEVPDFKCTGPGTWESEPAQNWNEDADYGIGAGNELYKYVKGVLDDREMSSTDGSLDGAYAELKEYVNENLGRNTYASVLRTLGGNRKSFAANKSIGTLNVSFEEIGAYNTKHWACTVAFNEEPIVKQWAYGNGENRAKIIQEVRSYLNQKLENEDSSTLTKWEDKLREMLSKSAGGAIHLEIGENGQDTSSGTSTETTGHR